MIDFVGPCWKKIIICTTSTQSKKRKVKTLVLLGSLVLSKMFRLLLVIEIRAWQPQSTHFKLLIADPSADYRGHLLLSDHYPSGCAISGTAHLSGTIPYDTGYSHSLTVPSVPEVINALESAVHAVVNYVHQPLSVPDGNA